MKTRTTKFVFSAAVAAMLLVATGTAHAAKFGVKVVSADGTPVAGAAVCIGTHGNYKQFAAVFTSSEGDVVVDVPPVPLLVTVSKSRFSAVRLSEPARRYNLIKTVKLQEGIPGPRCKADSSMADGSGVTNGGPSISKVDVRDKAFNVALLPRVSGGVNKYRIATSKSMRNAVWEDFSKEIVVDPKMLGKKVYLQVAKVVQQKGASLEAHSNVVEVNLQNL